jgi:VRR-NUC domain
VVSRSHSLRESMAPVGHSLGSRMASTPTDFTFTYHAAQRARFRTGDLAELWRARYSDLFDERDLKLLRTPYQRRYHFFEWLSAILLYEAIGYRSLVESYTARTHPEKRERLKSLVGGAIFEWLDSHQSGQPDLFVYSPQTNDWFFCEVKGGADRIRRNQIAWFEGFGDLMQERGITGARVRVLQLREVYF